MKPWTWWQGGVALGVLSALAMVVIRPMGTSTVYPSVIGMLLKPMFPDFVAANEYFKTIPLTVGWEHMLVLGLPLGAYLAYRQMQRQAGAACTVASGRGNGPGQATGGSPWRAFLGGFLVLFGARMAGGCTTGHILSGMTQMALSGFVFAAAVFAAGIPTALWLRRREA